MKKTLLALSLLGLLMPLVTSNYMDTDVVYRKEKLPTRYGMMEPPEKVTNRTTEYAWQSEQFAFYGERTGFFFGIMFCPIRQMFCASLTYELMDNNNETTFLAYVPLHCTKDGSLDHSAMVVFEKVRNPGEDIFESEDHSIGTPIIRILHTCQNAYRVTEQVTALKIPQESQAYEYKLNITEFNEVTRPMTTERAHFPIESLTSKWLERHEVMDELSKNKRFEPVTVRTLLREKELPYILRAAWNSAVFEQRCQHSTYDEDVLCSKTHYSYEGRTRNLRRHMGPPYGSEEDEFTRTRLRQ